MFGAVFNVSSESLKSSTALSFLKTLLLQLYTKSHTHNYSCINKWSPLHQLMPGIDHTFYRLAGMTLQDDPFCSSSIYTTLDQLKLSNRQRRSVEAMA